MLILTGVVLNLTISENGLIKIASNTAGKYKVEEIREKVDMAMTNVITKEMVAGNDITIEKVLQELLENETFETIDKEAEIGVIGDYDIKLKQNEDGSIVIDYVQKATGVRITYTLEPKEYTNKEKISILFKVQGKVKKVKKPDELIVYPQGNKIAIDYEVYKNGIYTFIVEDEEGTQMTKNVIVDTIDRLAPKEFTITASQVENKLVITTNAQDSEPDGTSVKSGIGRYEYFVKKSTDTNYPEKSYTTNEIEGLAYDTYTVYAKVYDKAGNSIQSSNEATVIIANPKIAKYGQQVNYEANGVSDWKIFYINEDTNETFIITSGYLPVGSVPPEAGLGTSGSYAVAWTKGINYRTITQDVRDRFMMSWNNNETNTNIKCVSNLLDTDAWDVFVSEKLKIKGSTAIGSPTLEMWLASWNECHPEGSIGYDISSEKGISVFVTGTEGIQNASSYNITLSKVLMPNDDLYFPYSSRVANVKSYYLSSPAHSNYPRSFLISYDRGLEYNDDFSGWYKAIRPVVCIPSDLLEYDSTTESWNIK